ncbi:MAG: DNA-3-methyladenine glycosylase [Fuerstiella sp.]
MTDDLHDKAVKYLKRTDSKLAKVIVEVGPCELKPQGGSFAILARSILSQQISVAAAKTIRRKLQALLPNRRMTAAAILNLSEDQLASVGVSNQKRGYLLDLATKVNDGEINFRRIAKRPDEEVIDCLIQVKGIGRWTAQMFLLFGLGRPDVFAPDDLAIRNAMINIFQLKSHDKAPMEEIASTWSPHRSVASWYLWRSLDTAKKVSS